MLNFKLMSGRGKPAETFVCCAPIYLCIVPRLILMACRAPVLFYKPVTALIGPLANIIIPKVAQPVEKHLPDYEVELTIVIGKSTKNVSEEDALDYVLAYTGGNDVSFVRHVVGYDTALRESSNFSGVISFPPNARLPVGLVERFRYVSQLITGSYIYI